MVAILLAAFSGVAVAGDDDEDGSDPAVVVLGATALSETTARLTGEVDPGGSLTTYVFEYGTSDEYGTTTVAASAGSTSSWRPVNVGIAQLQPGTRYHYRLVATNDEGVAASEDRTFTTSGATAGKPAEAADPLEAEQGEPPTEQSERPELAETVAAKPRGDVLVRHPGKADFVPLTAGELPVGSVVDARDGEIALTAALPSGETQTGRFGGGRFLVRQRRGGLVDLYLRGAYCPRAPAADGAAIAGAARKRRSGRRLWGRDKGGRFRTHGKNSHATVRGTRWVVADRCDGTLTRVTEGSVVVRDTVRRKRVIVRVGERYLARARR